MIPFTKLISSISTVCNEAKIKKQLCDFIEEYVLQEKYVTREEYEQLQHRISKLEEKLKNIKE